MRQLQGVNPPVVIEVFQEPQGRHRFVAIRITNVHFRRAHHGLENARLVKQNRLIGQYSKIG